MLVFWCSVTSQGFACDRLSFGMHELTSFSMVGKITKKLETAQGEVGYSGDIPVALGVYRTDYLESEGEKILP